MCGNFPCFWDEGESRVWRGVLLVTWNVFETHQPENEFLVSPRIKLSVLSWRSSLSERRTVASTVTSDSSFYKHYPCHSYLGMEKHLGCLAVYMYCVDDGISSLLAKKMFLYETKLLWSYLLTSVSVDSPVQCPGPAFQPYMTAVRWSFHFRIFSGQCGHSEYFYGGFVNLQFCCVSRNCYEVT